MSDTTFITDGECGGLDVAQDPKIVKTARIRRGLEGPQLVIEWDAPAEIPLGGIVRVVRHLYEFAGNENDGVIVFEGPTAAGAFADIELDPCKCYYYTVFAFDPLDATWHFSIATQVSEIAIETGFFTHKLFDLLPNIYVLGDKLLDDENKDASIFPLFKVYDPDGTEWFNIHENTDPSKEPKKRGPLSRFLKDIAIEPDIVKGLIDCMPTLWDVDETCCGTLPALGELIGVEVNREFPCGKQREEIKQQVAILKLKGTKTAIAARARLISGFRSEVQEWCGNILISNRLDRTSVKFPNPGFASTYRMFGDTTDYTPGGEIGFNSFSTFFFLECDDCLSCQIVKKLNRVMPPEYPICRTGHFVFVDCTFVEEYDRSRLQELSYEIDEDLTVENFITRCWLITNRLPGSPTLPGPNLNYPFEHDQSNSLAALTANPFRCIVEEWYDAQEEEDIFVEDIDGCVLISNRLPRISNSIRWRTPMDDLTCTPVDDWFDDVQVGEFVEEVNCFTMGLMFITNRPVGGLSGNPPSLSNTLQSLVGPLCGGDFWYDIEECLDGRINTGRISGILGGGCTRIFGPCGERVNAARVNCSRVNED